MQRDVFFDSDGLKLAGVLHTPDDMKAGERRPAVAVLHGFGGTKNGGVPLSLRAWVTWCCASICVVAATAKASEAE
jgi:fermentation-respiration switch protein FrsA (DUF1100 family)